MRIDTPMSTTFVAVRQILEGGKRGTEILVEQHKRGSKRTQNVYFVLTEDQRKELIQLLEETK